MTAFPTLRAAQAATAYGAAGSGFAGAANDGAGIGNLGVGTSGIGISGAGDFGGLVENALNAAISTGQVAESKAAGAINGQGDLTQVVTAVSRAELALQTTVAVRDRVLQAYQDIIKMSI